MAAVYAIIYAAWEEVNRRVHTVYLLLLLIEEQSLYTKPRHLYSLAQTPSLPFPIARLVVSTVDVVVYVAGDIQGKV